MKDDEVSMRPGVNLLLDFQRKIGGIIAVDGNSAQINRVVNCQADEEKG